VDLDVGVALQAGTGGNLLADDDVLLASSELRQVREKANNGFIRINTKLYYVSLIQHYHHFLQAL